MNLEQRNRLVSAALDKVDSAALHEEVEFRLNIDAEEQRESDVYQALLDAEETFAEWRQRGALKAARRVLIDLGVYKPMTDDQVATTIRTRGPAWDFKLNNVPYQFDRHLTT